MAQRKCKHCGQIFEKKRPLQYICSPLCATQYVMKRKIKAAAKAKLQAAQKSRAKQKALRHALETIPELTKKAQAEFNRFIRLRDQGKPCISCGKPLGDQANTYDAGHYRSVGSASHLRFDERNVHGQCKHCNRYLSGNTVAYRQGLIERIGLVEVERLECDNAPRKWLHDELRTLVKQYRQRVKEKS